MSDAADHPAPTRRAPALDARARAALKARAHALEPVVRIGHAGLTDGVVADIVRALETHELIKVKVGEGEREERAAVSTAICERTGAALVQKVGRVLVLWLPRPEE
ncbi:RNA-binding protein [Luteitalea sp. TBR-22]|uniref:ribosome assembly RNA-binding protein YhbY n=1 Tax=Luteitalea sp. TBR-22 TaxID=2802971 RepID=UPI001AFC9AF0|nr:ribosome assembly RNA-binding protein YhbY [Luteitalea sp. TBR-22]BCS31756.1 RNA-binding protein [Luteitalea sp. TBR-22]